MEKKIINLTLPLNPKIGESVIMKDKIDWNKPLSAQESEEIAKELMRLTQDAIDNPDKYKGGYGATICDKCKSLFLMKEKITTICELCKKD